MTCISEEFLNEMLSHQSVYYLGLNRRTDNGVITYTHKEMKDITVVDNEFWLDKGGTEEKKLKTVRDLYDIVIPIKNKAIQKRNVNNN